MAGDSVHVVCGVIFDRQVYEMLVSPPCGWARCSTVRSKPTTNSLRKWFMACQDATKWHTWAIIGGDEAREFKGLEEIKKDPEM
jgi:hypothetical protein